MNLLASETIPNTQPVSSLATEVFQLQANAAGVLQARFGSGFRPFVSATKPSYVWYKHCVKLADALDRVERGTLKRLMVWMPPQDGKSELTSRQYPAYHLYKHPTDAIISTSYAADLAFRLSRDAREYYLETGCGLKEDAAQVHNWMTMQGGGMLSAGVGGPITGSGGDILIIDDPIKNSEEAYSLTVQESQWDWWKTTFWSRRRPNAAIIIIMTRWVTNDLCGRLLEAEKDAPQGWHILSFPAIYVEPPTFPLTCTVEEDWRSLGEPLCPERRDLKELLQTRAVVGEEVWQAMDQQNPIASSGNIWKLDWFKPYDDSWFRRNGDSVQLSDDGCDWDTAYGGDKEEKNAASAFCRGAIGTDGNIYVSDCGFEWLEFPEQIDWMKKYDAPHYVEAKASGKSIVQALTKAGIYAGEVQVKGGDKIARTKIVTPIAQQKKVFIHRSIWDKLLFDPQQGILGFPARPFKDLNDAFVQLLNRLWPYSVEPAQELTEQEQEYADYMKSLSEEVLPVQEGGDWRDVDTI